VATLLVLQARGQITAAALAAELEVSERTARRDLECLAMAGIPVYARQGRGGGWSLLGGARTELTGLTAAEARALFLVAGPAVTMTPELGAALRKLVRALPEPFRPAAELAGRAVLHDSADWDRPRTHVERPVHLTSLQNAVIDGVQVRLGYAGRDRASTERLVHPLGLVAKGPTWYLVADTEAGLRTFHLSRIHSLEVTNQPARRPTGFDLDSAWRSTIASLDERRLPCSASVRAAADFAPVLRYVLGTRASLQVDGLLKVRGPSIEILAAQLAGFAEHIEVLQPEEVRAHLARLGVTLTRRYGRKQTRAKRSSGSVASPV